VKKQTCEEYLSIC